MSTTERSHDQTADGVTTVTIGMITDPGVPAKLGAQLVDELPQSLRRQLGERVRWRVDSTCQPLLLDERGMIPMQEIAAAYRRQHDWDLAVLITDLPRRADTRPIVAEYSTSHHVGLVSLPALGGGFRLETRLRELVVHLVGHLAEHDLGLDPHSRPRSAQTGGLLSSARHIDPVEDEFDQHLALTGFWGRFQLLRGMVHDNRPWRLVPHLASASAAAAAPTAIGIFSSSIWSMADALPPWRLAIITLVCTTAIVAWLILYNHLWDHPAGHARPGQAALYNLSTVLTLFLGVVCMYALLYAVALLAAAVVIDAGYLESQLGHAVGPASYAKLVWLSCSMGIVAGAVGSNLDSEAAVRQAAYSRRERERKDRNRAEAEDAEQD